MYKYDFLKTKIIQREIWVTNEFSTSFEKFELLYNFYPKEENLTKILSSNYLLRSSSI